MIKFTKGNLLEEEVEALVNTVNTVGVMGKGIALMFKEAFPENYKKYEAACKAGEVKVGHMFVVERDELFGPKWIINFPTKKHWRYPTKREWIIDGLNELRNFIIKQGIKSIAVPPLGCGNGGLDWKDVRRDIVAALADIENVEIVIFEPTAKYQNVAKKEGVEELTPARALIAELIRQYWILGIECTLLEIQKLAWFLERNIENCAQNNPLDLRFEANKFGPFASRLNHLLNALDGSYLHCDKRISDAGPMDIIWFDDNRKEHLQTYLRSSDVKPYAKALEVTSEVIDGFESPLGMELLATVDWLVAREKCSPTIDVIKECLKTWPGGPEAGERKMRIFNDRSIGLALERITSMRMAC